MDRNTSDTTTAYTALAKRRAVKKNLRDGSEGEMHCSGRLGPGWVIG